MIRSGKALVLCVLTVCSGARALTSDSYASHYGGIVERNVFDIHAAAPPPPPDPRAGQPPPPSIKLQGITDILGRKQVLFKVQLPPKPGTPAKEESFILTVGERQGEIEVLDINPKEGTVRMRNYGVETNLSLDLNGDKLVNVAPVAAPAPTPSPGQMTAPGALAPPPTLPTLPKGNFPRTLRLPGSTPSNTGSPNYGGGTSLGTSGTSFGSANYNPSDQSQPQPPMSPEARALLIEAQRLKYKQEGNPLANILPPTSATPRNEEENPQTPQLP